MPRSTTPIGLLPNQPAADDATMMDFVCALVDIIVATRSAEQLFAEETMNDCLRLVVMKNNGLDEFGNDPWPEVILVDAARSHLEKLRAARRH